ncbi:MAG TPA: serine/threonine-protein kinase [Clostridia bacterium]|nr:serine/threonine-protein kinase [Clostridia bacterium]
MQAGDFFNGRYVIEDILGQGGMGTVYLARNINTDTFWAIKEFAGLNGLDTDLMAEPNLLKKLEHPALPRLFDILEQDGKAYMVFDYISGISLDKKLEAEGRVACDTVVEWAIQLCRALEYLHGQKPNPIIYRDMKPSNIILTGNGTLKLIDFGIAREYKPKSTADTVFIGTRGYAAPEQYGTGQTGAASDIYSLGVTLHQLLTGKNPAESPFGLKPVRFYDDSLSPILEAIISKCTCENSKDRYQSATELLSELEGFRRDRETSVWHSGPEEYGSGKNDKAYPGHSFHKMIITVWDNAEFGCELAYAAAKYTRSEVVLADLDLLAPKADLFLNTGKRPSSKHEAGIFGYSGLDMVMEAIGKGMLTAGLLQHSCISRKDIQNLHVITGNYRLENYEYYDENSVPKLMDRCYRSFDITILLVNRSIYDAFTLSSLLRSDLNIAAIRGDIDQFREFNSYISFLKDKQQLPSDNTKFVLYEYDKSSGMSIAQARAATQGNLLGTVSASRRRAAYRNMRSVYASHMEKEVTEDYKRLLVKLGLLPARGLSGKGRPLTGHFGNRSGNEQSNALEVS